MGARTNAYALLIGIDDYRCYDGSAGLPAGTSDLAGAVADAEGWRRIALAIGLPPANIRVITAPAGVGGAHLADLRAGLDWLAAQLQTSDVNGGFVAISAHGSYDPTLGSLLCPGDVEAAGDGLANALPVAEIFSRLDARAPRTPVTVFLDACDASAGGGRDRRRALRGRAPGADAPHTPRKRPTDLLVAASRPGAESFEINVGGEGHGAFSWAAQALIDRWGLHTAADGDVHVDLPYGDLTARLNALLTAMEVGQTCHFDAPAGQDARRVFAELKGLEAGQAAAPADLGGREVSPGSNGKILVYKVTRVSGDVQKATLYAPGKNCGTAWESGKFYWSGASEGWDWLAAGLASGHEFKIAYDSTVDSTPTNPYTQPTNVKVYVNSSTWNPGATIPTLKPEDRMGSFTFDGSTGYVVTGTGETIEWYLPSQPSSGYIVDASNALKIVPIVEPTAPSGSFYGDD